MNDVDRIGAPGYWPNETSGVLAPVVTKYIQGLGRVALDTRELAIMRAYLEQWINAPGFMGADIDKLRHNVRFITDMARLKEWLRLAVDAGVDPL